MSTIDDYVCKMMSDSENSTDNQSENQEEECQAVVNRAKGWMFEIQDMIEKRMLKDGIKPSDQEFAKHFMTLATILCGYVLSNTKKTVDDDKTFNQLYRAMMQTIRGMAGMDK